MSKMYVRINAKKEVIELVSIGENCNEKDIFSKSELKSLIEIANAAEFPPSGSIYDEETGTFTIAPPQVTDKNMTWKQMQIQAKTELKIFDDVVAGCQRKGFHPPVEWFVYRDCLKYIVENKKGDSGRRFPPKPPIPQDILDTVD